MFCFVWYRFCFNWLLCMLFLPFSTIYFSISCGTNLFCHALLVLVVPQFTYFSFLKWFSYKKTSKREKDEVVFLRKTIKKKRRRSSYKNDETKTKRWWFSDCVIVLMMLLIHAPALLFLVRSIAVIYIFCFTYLSFPGTSS